jgi:hypothetical protein
MNDERSPFILNRSSFLFRSLIVATFFATRLPLLFVRDFFYDELFTRWISAKSLVEIVRALRYDSGPPLFYFLVHALGNPPLLWVRAVSLVASAVALLALLARKHELAALFVAVFPPAVLFAVDARSYALCAMFVTLGMLSLERCEDAGLKPGPRQTSRRWMWAGLQPGVLAALFVVAAAYSHYYGALFIPLLLRKPRALLLAVLLFAPGLWLAAVQPPEARAWMTMAWPDALFVRPPLLLAIGGAVVLLLALRSRRIALATLLPLALALLLRVYVPLRFESVIAAPLSLWWERSLAGRPRRELLAFAAIAIGLTWTLLGIADHLRRPPGDYRAAADFVAEHAGARTVVASGYLYLETVVRRPAISFPPEQALHPGWRAFPPPGLTPPAPPFWWVGERGAPELELIRRGRRADVVFANARAAVVAVH